MVNITKKFPGIIANDNVTLQLKAGEIHALLGENGAGKSTLMSVLFGLYQAEEGVIKKNGEIVQINNPNDANELGIGMVHQHFKLVECFSVLDNIILGVEDTKNGMLQRDKAREKVMALPAPVKGLVLLPLWTIGAIANYAVSMLLSLFVKVFGGSILTFLFQFALIFGLFALALKLLFPNKKLNLRPLHWKVDT